MLLCVALMGQMFAGIGYFIYKAMPTTVVAHYVSDHIYLCETEMGERELWLPSSLPIHAVSATISMGTREYNKLHLELDQICVNKLDSLEGDKFEQARQRVKRRSRSVGTCRDTMRTDLEKLMVLWELHLHPWSSTVHKQLFKH